ncbi:hypothetical protein L3V65_02240 [Heyndrickxia coagulans]|uniref:hypothetical protein n=1 Tax=Heyndrickxia coagulans TaxID=1398 RepID=UPI001F33F5A9|nr:hypothetical protein [Heyndrickxia coagulans]UJZ87873.1 hypothetical protein L3V65_02240 [Heyndrickxia coagulans]
MGEIAETAIAEIIWRVLASLAKIVARFALHGWNNRKTLENPRFEWSTMLFLKICLLKWIIIFRSRERLNGMLKGVVCLAECACRRISTCMAVFRDRMLRLFDRRKASSIIVPLSPYCWRAS